ncbi:MAG: hypothetical protein QXG86_02990 [Candidatus Woesearchaeota archaeon]
MERVFLSKKNALQRIKAADHILTQTFPSLKDTRLLLSVIHNIFQALEYCISAILYYDRALRKIPPFHNTFESKFNVFVNTSVRIHHLQEFVVFIKKVNSIIKCHKSSPIEFTRNNSFIICDDNYRMITINFEELKKMLDETKRLYFSVEKITAHPLQEVENE